MIKIVKRIIKRLILLGFIVFVILFLYFFIGTPSETQNIIWGVNFSQKHSGYMGLDWKENYLAILNDLKPKRIKLITHWDQLEQEKGKYNFNDLDWQIEQSAQNNTELLLAIGMKTPRWPECHIPDWARDLPKQEQQESILNLIEKIVLRYKNVQSPALNNVIWGWQVENEPFFPFGNCPWVDAEFLNKEIALVKRLDNKNRPVFTTESGEAPLWIRAAMAGDMVGTSLYKKVWVPQIGIYVHYPYPAIFYSRKILMIKTLFNKKVICAELQAEPWGPKLLYDVTLEEMAKTMDLGQFNNMINFAKKAGFDEFYLWGAEWWYWMKQEHNQPEIWNEVKKLL